MAADLRRYYGLPLRALFCGEVAPDEAWDLIAHLPRDSATQSAIYADPGTVTDDDGGEAAEPRLTEFGPVVEVLAAIHDLQASLLATVASLGGGRPPKVRPYPRPGDARRTLAKARRREQARQEWAELCKAMGVEA